MNYRTITISFLLLSFCTSVNAAPDYVTAWPKKVKVESPDPVLGDKPYWEYWSYSKFFAQTFKGFSEDRIDPELKNGIYAIALRIYKRNLWEGVNSDYPKQYSCEYDIYFDNAFKLPFNKKNRKNISPDYPENVTPSVVRIHLKKNIGLNLDNIVTLTRGVSVSPRIFSFPMDGRFAGFGVKIYYPDITPTISMIVLGQGVSSCKVISPLKKGGAHWISLLGKTSVLPYITSAIDGIYNPNIKEVDLNSNEMNFNNGYFKVPDKFYKQVLPKVTLAKVVNKCIYKEHAISIAMKKSNKKNDAWKEISERCNDIKKYGLISDPYLDSSREHGLTETGY